MKARAAVFSSVLTLSTCVLVVAGLAVEDRSRTGDEGEAPSHGIVLPWAPSRSILRPAVPTRPVALDDPIVFTQLPAGGGLEAQPPLAGGTLRASYGEGARIVLLQRDGATRVLSAGFASAADPDVSFDGQRIVFAGQRTPADDWNIFEVGIDGSGLRQITRDLGDCRSPIYLSTQYTIISTEPWYQIAFASTAAREATEYGALPATHLYTTRLDGSQVRRLTFNLSSDFDPFLMRDGRILFASWQRSRLHHGPLGRVALFALNNDGADLSTFAGEQGERVRHMPTITTGGLAVFVEADRMGWDGAGRLGGVALRRPLHSYRKITETSDGLFHSPSPLPDGSILVSRRPRDGTGTHGIWKLDLASGRAEVVFDDPTFHDIQAKVVRARTTPDGRSSVVNEEDPHGELYGLNVTITDLQRPEWMDLETVRRLRVLEGLPRRLSPQEENPDVCPSGIAPLAVRRVLGDIPLQADGSFYIEVPADTPIELQVLDENNMALRSCGWIWAKNHEPRGCIGCHEDQELAPENFMPAAVTRPPVSLTLPAERRRTVDFRTDIMPIIANKCATSGCHASEINPVHLGEGRGSIYGADGAPCFNRAYETLLSGAQENGTGRYVDPGQARTSRLIWSLLGRNTSRPWDRSVLAVGSEWMPPDGHQPLTAEEIRAFIEWIDMGAQWDGRATSSGGER